MKIATWNVNSLKVRLQQVLQWLQAERPDVLALQETKLSDEQFPTLEIEAAGYHAIYSGQKTYNGVALLSRQAPQSVVQCLPGVEDPQRRLLCACYGDLRVIDVYVPNGEAVASEKYPYKLEWLSGLAGYVREQLVQFPRLIVLGDFNVAPEERDVHDPVLWEGRVLFSEPERAAVRALLDAGLCDTFRLFDQPEKSFSWWDYRLNAFRRNLGLRIDHILASRACCERCISCRIDRGPRRLERPSDHAPVVAEFAD